MKIHQELTLQQQALVKCDSTERQVKDHRNALHRMLRVAKTSVEDAEREIQVGQRGQCAVCVHRAWCGLPCASCDATCPPAWALAVPPRSA